LPRRPASSWLPGMSRNRSCLIWSAKMPWSRMSACTVRTSPTTRLAALVEAIGLWETSWAPKSQQITQTPPSAAMAPSENRRWPAVTALRRSIARTVKASRAAAPATMPMTTRFASVRPIAARSVSMPIPA